jgi:hypothetical protein
MHCYINIVPAAHCSVRPVWPDGMIEGAISEIRVIEALHSRLRAATSTREMLDCVREIKEFEAHNAHVLADGLEDELANLKENS